MEEKINRFRKLRTRVGEIEEKQREKDRERENNTNYESAYQPIILVHVAGNM